ncbi:hypothetical protein [Enterocloster bolteae]
MIDVVITTAKRDIKATISNQYEYRAEHLEHYDQTVSVILKNAKR